VSCVVSGTVHFCRDTVLVCFSATVSTYRHSCTFFRALATAILQHRVRSLPIETSFFVLIRLLPCMCAILCLLSVESASVSLVHCNTSSCALSLISVKLLFRVALPHFYLHRVCFRGSCHTISTRTCTLV
jgi:hypothetical protein